MIKSEGDLILRGKGFGRARLPGRRDSKPEGGPYLGLGLSAAASTNNKLTTSQRIFTIEQRRWESWKSLCNRGRSIDLEENRKKKSSQVRC